MKLLNYCTGWMSHSQTITDHALADAAYEAMKKAMNEHDRFDNDKKALTIKTGEGTSLTVRIEHLVSVTLDDCAQAEADIIERHVWEASLKSKIAARLAPAENADH